MSKRNNAELDRIDPEMKYKDGIMTEPEAEDIISKPSSEAAGKDNIKSCKVMARLRNNKVIIDFNGSGLLVTVKDTGAENIKIKYSGEIGQPGFRYEVQ